MHHYLFDCFQHCDEHLWRLFQCLARKSCGEQLAVHDVLKLGAGGTLVRCASDFIQKEESDVGVFQNAAVVGL